MNAGDSEYVAAAEASEEWFSASMEKWGFDCTLRVVVSTLAMMVAEMGPAKRPRIALILKRMMDSIGTEVYEDIEDLTENLGDLFA